MSRPRKHNKHLPEKVYQDKKSKMFYFVDAQNKYHQLGRTQDEALGCYYRLMPYKTRIITMAHLINRYMAEKSPLKAPSTHADEKKSAKQLVHRLGHFLPHEVKPVHLAEYIDYRMKEAQVRPNREMSLLSVVFKQAPFWGVDVMNPVAGIKRINEGARKSALKQERYITNEQIIAFKPHAPKWLQFYVELKQLTGLRQTAMLRMRKNMVTRDFLLVPDISKKGGMIQYHWNDRLRSLVNSIIDALNPSDEYFFTSAMGKAHNPSSFKSAWQRAIQKAIKNGLKKRFSERYLRNKAVTDCEDLERASKTIGHTNTFVTKQHYSMLGTKVEPFDKCV
jgi:integrase